MQIILTILIALVVFLLTKYQKHILKNIKKLFRRLLQKKMSNLGNDTTNQPVSNGEQTNEKFFQFHRVKVQTKRESFSNDRLVFGIPKKRSGHRAVCDDEYLYIWGGYCPFYELNIDDDEDEQTLPLFPEVCEFYELNFSI